MRLLHFILSHSLFIALCALALCYQTACLLHFTIDFYLYAFVGFATLCSYNFYWMLGSYTLIRSSPLQFIQKHYSNIFFFISAGVIALVCAAHLRSLWILMMIAVGLTLTYAVPLMPFKWLHFTRRAGFLKPVVLSFTWAFVTVYLPCSTTDLEWQLVSLLFSSRFLFVLMLCIIFDNRDEQVDKVRGLHSLATDIKPSMLRYIMFLLFIAYLVNGILLRTYFHEILQIAALLITGVLTLIVYVYSQRKQGYFFYYFLVDGLMLFSSLATYVASI